MRLYYTIKTNKTKQKLSTVIHVRKDYSCQRTIQLEINEETEIKWVFVEYRLKI